MLFGKIIFYEVFGLPNLTKIRCANNLGAQVTYILLIYV